MKIKKSLIAPAVAELAKIATARAFPIMQCVRMSAANNRLKMFVCDLDQSLGLELDCEGDLQEMAPQAAKLNQLLVSAAEDVELAVKDFRMNIKSGFSSTIGVQDPKEFPEFKSGAMKKVGVNCADLATAIKSVAWCAAKESNHRSNMRSVHVRLEPKMLVCEAGDGMQLAKFSQPAICAKADFCIPADMAVRFRWALEQDGATLALSENMVRVEFDGGDYACKIYDLPYPKTEAVCSAPKELIGKVDAGKLNDLIRSPLFMCPKTQTPAALMSFSTEAITVETVFAGDEFSGAIAGSFHPRVINVNAQAMSLCLSAFEGEISISIAENKMMVLESGNLAVYTMPLR